MNANVSKTNGVKLLAVVAVLAMVVCAFAAVMPAEETEAAAGDTQYYSGTLDKVQSFSDGTNVIIDKPLTITEKGFLIIDGANITINEGVTVTIEKGGVFFLSAGNSEKKVPTVATVNGNIVVKSGSYLYNAATSTVKTEDGKTAGGMTLNGSIEVQRGGIVDNRTIDTSTDLDAAGEDNATAGTITVSANGSIKSLGTKTTPSTFNNQNISMAVGATVDLTSKIKGVTVDANVGTGVYTYGSVTLAAGSGTQEITNISFSVTSERIADAYLGKAYGTAESYARANAYILDISGSLGAYTDATVKANPAVTADGNLLFMKDYDKDKAIDVQIKGTVSITSNFDVNANTGFTVDEYAIVNVSGSIDVAGKAATTDAGSDAAMATLTLKGIINVSGQVTIDSVAAKTAGGTVNLVDGNSNIKKAYLNIIGEGEITIEDYAFNEDYTNAPLGVNGVTYTDKDDVFHVTNLDKAVAGATSENNGDEITIWGYNFGRGKVAYTNPYVINADYTFPEDLTVNVEGYAIIAEGATVTVPESASLTGGNSVAKLIVEGALMDYTMAADEAAFTLTADVRTIDADETYYLYTSLKAALADANEGDTVQIYGNNKDATVTVDIEENLTIQSGVTVDVGAGKTLKVNKNVTLTIDGVLDLSENTAALNLENAASPDKTGAVVLNNMIIVDDITDFQTEIPGFYVVGDIGETINGNYIMAPAVAAANSATLTEVIVKGNVSYNGDLTFTAGEDETSDIEITISGAKVSISKIIIDGYTVKVAAGKEFTGTVEAAVTAGTSAVTFEKSGNVTVKVTVDETGETPVTSLVLDKTDASKVSGKITISAGSVTLEESIGVGATRATVLTVAEGATFVVPEGVYLKVDTSTEQDKDYSAIVIDGTLALDNAANFQAEQTSKPMTVNGTMTVVGDNAIPENFTVIVNGTLAVSEVEDKEGSLTVEGSLVVGTAPETIGVGGTVTGPVTIYNGNYITVYAGASVEAEKLNANPATGESSAVATEFFINGTLYKTVYAIGDVKFYVNATTSVLPAAGTEIVGYDTKNINDIAYWFTDADYKNKVDASATVGSEGNEALYFNAPAQKAAVQFSIGSGISLFVDGIRVTSAEGDWYSVGTHTVTATVNPGYTGDVTITFNGQTITGGTFEVTADMADQTQTHDTVFVLSATGNIAVDSGASGSSDGMGLTEILLIILVVLIVVMAIMVALRLMRS